LYVGYHGTPWGSMGNHSKCLRFPGFRRLWQVEGMRIWNKTGSISSHASVMRGGSQNIAAERCSFSVLTRERIYARFGRENARRPISRVLSRPLAGPWMTIPLGRPLPGASRDLPGWLRRKRRLPHRFPGRPAIPMRSCSRWGLPCRRRYRRRGALLPHRFTLTCAPALAGRGTGGLLSVALSLGSPPPGITRHRVSVEPGLSSNPPSPASPRSSSRLARAEVERWGRGVNRSTASHIPGLVPRDPHAAFAEAPA
jgi:hypothetical protein